MTYSEKTGNSERPLKNPGNIKIINIIINAVTYIKEIIRDPYHAST